MARVLWCLNAGCGTGYGSVAGDVPNTCPACLQPAHWSAINPPLRPYTLTKADRAFLRSLAIRIDP